MIIGMYSVTYHVIDEQGNPAQRTVYIDVEDTTDPYFDPIDDQTFNIGDPSPVDWEALVTNIVDYSPTTIGVEDYIDYWSIGIYQVIITVADEEGNFMMRTFNVEVVDSTPPEIFIYEDIHVALGEYPDYYGYFYIYDDVDGDVTYLAILNDITLDINTVGTYTVEIMAEDFSGNVAYGSIDVHVHDWTPPTFDPIEDQVFELGDYEGFDWTTLVVNVNDNWDPSPTVMVIHEDV